MGVQGSLTIRILMPCACPASNLCLIPPVRFSGYFLFKLGDLLPFYSAEDVTSVQIQFYPLPVIVFRFSREILPELIDPLLFVLLLFRNAVGDDSDHDQQ